MPSSHLLVTNEKGEILLVQRRDVPLWVVPGGHIEVGESPKDTAEREFLEETGILAKANRLVALYESRRSRKYLYKGKLQNGQLKKGAESRDFGWFKPSKLPSPISLYERSKIADFLRYKGKVIKRRDNLSLRDEVINQAKSPMTFLALLLHFINNWLFGSRSFKLKL